MSTDLPFSPRETHAFSRGELQVHDVIANPSQHFDSTKNIEVHIGEIKEAQLEKYLPYAITSEDRIVMHGELRLATTQYDSRADSFPSHLSTGSILAEAIFSHCFTRQRAKLESYLRQIPDQEWNAQFQ